MEEKTPDLAGIEKEIELATEVADTSESLRAVSEQGWLWKLLDFPTANPATAEAFAAMRAEMHRWLAEKLP